MEFHEDNVCKTKVPTVRQRYFNVILKAVGRLPLCLVVFWYSALRSTRYPVLSSGSLILSYTQWSWPLQMLLFYGHIPQGASLVLLVKWDTLTSCIFNQWYIGCYNELYHFGILFEHMKPSFMVDFGWFLAFWEHLIIKFIEIVIFYRFITPSLLALACLCTFGHHF